MEAVQQLSVYLMRQDTLAHICDKKSENKCKQVVLQSSETLVIMSKLELAVEHWPLDFVTYVVVQYCFASKLDSWTSVAQYIWWLVYLLACLQANYLILDKLHLKVVAFCLQENAPTKCAVASSMLLDRPCF